VDLESNNNRAYDYQFRNDESTFLVAGGNQRLDRSNLGVTQTNRYRYLWENTATYQRTFAEKHSLTLLAGTVVEEGQTTRSRARARTCPPTPASGT
jgi:hypothetical protein